MPNVDVDEIIRSMRGRGLHQRSPHYFKCVDEVLKETESVCRSQGFVQWEVVMSASLALAGFGRSRELCDYFALAYMQSQGFSSITRVDIIADNTSRLYPEDDVPMRSLIQVAQDEVRGFPANTSIEFYMSQHESDLFLDVESACSSGVTQGVDSRSFQRAGIRYMVQNRHSYCNAIIAEFRESLTPRINIADEAKHMNDNVEWVASFIREDILSRALNNAPQEEGARSHLLRR